MLLGVLLAVLSGVLVIYIVSQATSNAGASVQLVVVKQNISSGTTLTLTDIQQDFGSEPYPANLVPAGAYVFTNQDQLQVHLNLSVVLVEMVPGDILLSQDPRIGPPGTNGHSITSLNQNALGAGDVLFNFQYASPSSATLSYISPGDKVDIIVLECNAPYTTTSGCTAATTLEGISVYATFQGSVVLILTTKEAAQLTVLANSGTVSFAIQNPADKTAQPALVTPQDVAHSFFLPTPTPIP
jgi:Flp pilus assembly protein CpaB